MPKPESLTDRMKLLLSTADGADVHFLVGSEGAEKKLFKAHKPILRSASDVFEAMFHFDAEKAKTTAEGESSSAGENSSVVVTDVEHAEFSTMLSYIYTEDLRGLNGENAMDLLYAAKKYLITGLIKACLAFPISSLRNVFLSMAKARRLDENDFARRCLAYIDQNIATLIQSEAFLKIDQSLLCEILDRDQLKYVAEITIWNAAIRWADAQCRQNGQECSAANRRAVLGPALYKLRVPDDIIELFCSFVDDH